MNIIEAKNYIDNLKNPRCKGIIKKSLDLLGNPERNYKKIIVSGTNGKGSTIEFLKNLIYQKENVGAFTSPHLYNINERFNVNLLDISDEDFLKTFNIIYELSNKYNFKYSYFEFLTLMAYVYFSDKKVSYGIFEVGIGGLDDATNEINYDLSIITSISYDHMDKLGNSLEEIASNKLSIVKNNKLIYSCSDEIYHYMWIKLLDEVDSTYVSKRNLDIYDSIFASFNYLNKPIDLNVIGKNQAVNAMIAIEAINYFELNIKPRIIKKTLEDTFIKCRLERVYINPTVIIDGGHNIEAINNLIDVLKKYNKKIIVIYASMKDKDHKSIIEKLEKSSYLMAFTEFDDERCEDYSKLFDECNINKIKMKDYKELIEKIVNEYNNDYIIAITGSFYFVSLARKLFRK